MSPTNRKCGRAAGTLNCEYLTFLFKYYTDISHLSSCVLHLPISLYQPLVTPRVHYLVTSHVLPPPRRRGNCGSSPAFPATQDTASGGKHCGRGGRGRGGGGAGRGAEGVLSALFTCVGAAAITRVTAALPQTRDYQSVATLRLVAILQRMGHGRWGTSSR